MGITNLIVNPNKKLITKDFVSFVITENCSFQCAHCLRGERRANTISKDVIDAVLSQVKINGELNLSGGEPLLRVDMITYLFEEIFRLDNKSDYISFFTNGSVAPRKFEEFVKLFKENRLRLSIKVSNDYYHVLERLRLNNNVDNLINRLREYQEILIKYGYNEVAEDYYWLLESYYKYNSDVVAIGKGKNIENAKIYKRKFKLDNKISIGGKIKGSFQVQTDGRITKAMDMSWEEVDEHYGPEYNILDNPLKKILRCRK